MAAGQDVIDRADVAGRVVGPTAVRYLLEGLMKSRLLATLTCLFLFQLALWGQTQRPTKLANHVSQMADEKIEVSRLDWIMVTARPRMLEQILAHEASRTISPVGMEYDAERKCVLIKGFVDPLWIASAKLTDAKDALKKEATSYCVDGLMLAEAENGEFTARGQT